jgi:hypothetical protein
MSNLEKLLKYLEYDSTSKTLYFNPPKGFKIKINGDINQFVEGEYNINSKEDINIISHDGFIYIDGNPTKGIHLNSYISKFSKKMKSLYNKIYGK